MSLSQTCQSASLFLSQTCQPSLSLSQTHLSTKLVPQSNPSVNQACPSVKPFGQPNILLQLIQTYPSDKPVCQAKPVHQSNLSFSQKQLLSHSCLLPKPTPRPNFSLSHAIKLVSQPNLLLVQTSISQTGLSTKPFHKEQSDLTPNIQQQGIGWMISVVNTNESVKADHSRKNICKQNHGFRNLSIIIETNIVFLSNFQSIKQFLYSFITQRIYVADN